MSWSTPETAPTTRRSIQPCWLCTMPTTAMVDTASGYPWPECGRCTEGLTTPLTPAERAAYESFHAKAEFQRALRTWPKAADQASSVEQPDGR